MTIAATTETAFESPESASADRPPLELVCNEVWGGNRGFDGPIELPGLRGYLYSRPCEGARGGDVYYLSTCGSGMIARICVADVAGHGEQIAEVSSVMHAHLKRSVNRLDQRGVIRGLNQRLVDLDDGTMTTLAALTYLPPTGSLRISYAGHEPAWLYRRKIRRWERLKLSEQEGLYDLAMAIDSKARYSQRKIRMNEGDRVLLLTDGVLEAPDADGDFFGADRVSEILNDHSESDCQTIGHALLGALRTHVGTDALAHDDVTLLLLEFANNTRGPAIWRMLRNRILRPKGNSHLPVFADGAARPVE